MMIGSEEATFLSQAVPPSTQPEDAEMVIVENRIVDVLQAGGVPVSADDRLFLYDALRLLGDSPRGLAIKAVNTSNVRTLLCGVAWRTVEGLYELEQIDQDELDGARRLVIMLDAQLCALATSKIPQDASAKQFINQPPSITQQPVLCFHRQLASAKNYSSLAAVWHLAIVRELRLGTMRASSSVSAFLTPLRHFTRSAEPDTIPASLFSLSEGERDRLSQYVELFFGGMQLAKKTVADYTLVVRRALGLTDARNIDGSVFEFGQRHRIAELDDDPPEQLFAGDTYTWSNYVAKIPLADSADNLLAIDGVVIQNSDNGDVEVMSWDESQKELIQSAAYSWRYLQENLQMQRHNTPCDRRSLSPHLMCIVDRKLIEPNIDSVEETQRTLLMYLLCHFGLNIKVLLAANICYHPINISASDPLPGLICDATRFDLYYSSSLALPHPTIAQKVKGEETVDSQRQARVTRSSSSYTSVTPVRHLPLPALGRLLVQRLIETRAQDLRYRIVSSATEQPLFVTVTPTDEARRKSREDVNHELLDPLNEKLAKIPLGSPRITFQRLQRFFWSAYTNCGLSPEDAALISDQHHPELFAPMFYINRSAEDIRCEYEKAHKAVCASLGVVYKGMFPKGTSKLFSASPTISSEISAHYGSNFRPREDVVKVLVRGVLDELHKNWNIATPPQRYEMLSRATALGLSLGYGLRIGEAVGMTQVAVDLPHTIAIQGKSDRFAEEYRVLPLLSSLVKPLEELIVFHQKSGMPLELESSLFYRSNKNGHLIPLTRENLWKWLRRVGGSDAAFRWHGFRHRLLSLLVGLGVFEFEIRCFVTGHSGGQQWLNQLRPAERRHQFDRVARVLNEPLSSTGFCLDEFRIWG